MPTWEDVDARQHARREREQRAAESIFNAIGLNPTEQQRERVMISLNHFAADVINADRQRLANDFSDALTEHGVEVNMAHFTADESSPTKYWLNYGDIRTPGPTFDLALLEFVLKLLR
jgi:hypothetical protein